MNIEATEVAHEQVEIVRGVRFGRIILVFTFLGGVVGLIVTLLNDVPQGALYEMAQIAGFMVVVGAVGGLLAGTIFSLVLNMLVRKKKGHGLAILHEVGTEHTNSARAE